ncbi:hypothetical protein [Massilia niabensis]|uniref:Uncharacterized protein n=1 Tax=Massilia niabensis TaxID=544910 RepID=A0ABW0L389_9BURK
MKRNNDVYFITLIDLLVQIIFLALLLYVVGKAGEDKQLAAQRSATEKVERALKASGVSNITELTDELTKLGPIKEMKGTADFISRAGGAAMADRLVGIVTQVGGVERLEGKLDEAAKVQALVDRAGGGEKVEQIIKKFEEGSGKPPCLFTIDREKKSARAVATVSANDESISFEGSNPELETMLALLGRSYSSVQTLSFSDFKSTFSALPQLKPECRYTLRLIEKTNLVHARDAARFAFYLHISKARE